MSVVVYDPLLFGISCLVALLLLWLLLLLLLLHRLPMYLCAIPISVAAIQRSRSIRVMLVIAALAFIGMTMEY